VVDHLATRDVDEQRAALDSIELGAANQTPRLRRMRRHDHDDVALREQIVQAIGRPDGFDARRRRLAGAPPNRADAEAEWCGDPDQLETDCAEADDSHPLTLQRPDVRCRPLDLVLRPAALELCADRDWKPARERDGDAEDVLGDRAGADAARSG